MGNLVFGGGLNETPGTTSTARKLNPMERYIVSPHEKEVVASFNGAQIQAGATQYIAAQPGATCYNKISLLHDKLRVRLSSGGASASKQPGHFQVTKVVRQVIPSLLPSRSLPSPFPTFP